MSRLLATPPRGLVALAALALTVTIAVTVAGAQEPFRLEDFFAPPPVKAAWILDWGATVSPAALYERQSAGDAAVAGLSGAAWARLSLPGQWQLYARVRDSALLTMLPAPEAGAALTNAWEVNAAYLQIAVPEAGLSLTLGRKPFILGSGLALSGSGDGLEFQLSSSVVTAKGFGFYTGFLEPAFSSYGMHAADIDGGARRYVGGYQVGLALFGHELSLLGLYQGDFGQVSEKLYTSWYTGLQAKGLLAGGDYLVECFLEEGYSPLAAASAAIQAFGGTVRYQRVFGAVTSPAVAVQYSLASGDPDRTAAKGSVGNATGADAGFQAFGQVASGSVYRPYFSNMHIASVGASFNPLEANPGRVKNSSVGLKYFYYAKYAAEGVVNSGEAALSSHDLGHGLDLSVRYSPYSDLSVFVSAGLFLPGAAFPQGEPLRFGASGGLSFSF